MKATTTVPAMASASVTAIAFLGKTHSLTRDQAETRIEKGCQRSEGVFEERAATRRCVK